MENLNFDPETSEDQIEFPNSSIGIGDSVEVVLNGDKMLGVVDWAEMANGRQMFNIRIKSGGNGGKGKILEDVPQENLRKLRGNHEEELTLS